MIGLPSLYVSFLRIEGYVIFCPSLMSRIFSRAEGEPPAILLRTVILVYGDGVGLRGKVSLEGHTIISPSVIGWTHVCAEEEPPTTVSLALVVVELVDGDRFGVLIVGSVECDTVVGPPLAQHGVCGESEAPSIRLYSMVPMNCSHLVENLNIFKIIMNINGCSFNLYYS